MNEKDLDKLNVGMDEEVYTLRDEEGTEKQYRKILEFTNPTNNNLYYIFAEEEKIDDEELQIFPMVCIEEADGIRFEPVETDEEYDMISEVLDILYFDEESE
ncbi:MULTISPECIES: DUF1292 domain-containing protein [unclassified Gemella]|uniref:DUF1292 domain-containing protein n=1 Tax=unclassified Gemella TaxID=2624949 RepID=UPI001C045C88|nr:MULTISPECIES: DUF1292 domain-containing protein [unclassified Gemella]MBU0278133.1 DUF1292 domain-containing protein [Gemella sp. zg-1178]QWQ38342.1 DUF1292 domain-containing protein [Gemella sp. zg-570]